MDASDFGGVLSTQDGDVGAPGEGAEAGGFLHGGVGGKAVFAAEVAAYGAEAVRGC